jgi:hypothetical protein
LTEFPAKLRAINNSILNHASTQRISPPICLRSFQQRHPEHRNGLEIESLAMEQAREKLGRALRGLSDTGLRSCTRREHCRKVSSLIQKFPSLAQEVFFVPAVDVVVDDNDDDHDDLAPPLVVVLRELPLDPEAHLALVKQIYFAYPEVTVLVPIALLDYAIARSLPEEVILFLLIAIWFGPPMGKRCFLRSSGKRLLPQ